MSEIYAVNSIVTTIIDKINVNFPNSDEADSLKANSLKIQSLVV